jgi:hypothetical protein
MYRATQPTAPGVLVGDSCARALRMAAQRRNRSAIATTV